MNNHNLFYEIFQVLLTRLTITDDLRRSEEIIVWWMKSGRDGLLEIFSRR